MNNPTENPAYDYTTAQTSAAVAADLATELGHVEPIQLQTESKITPELLTVPAGRTIVSAKQFHDLYRTAPERREGKATFTDLGSFVEHVNRFKDEHSAIFAQAPQNLAASPTMVSVLDYHEQGAKGAPRFGRHRGVYTFPLSSEWQAWVAKNGKPMSQAEFAAFIEDRLPDVVDPADAGPSATALAAKLGIAYATPGEMLAASRGLTVLVGQHCKSHVNLASGESSFVFETTNTTETGSRLDVPAAFIVEIPVFRNGAPYQLAVRLRYRAREGEVKWFVELYRVEAAFDDAFDVACSEAEEKTGLPLYLGTPE